MLDTKYHTLWGPKGAELCGIQAEETYAPVPCSKTQIRLDPARADMSDQIPVQLLSMISEHPIA